MSTSKTPPELPAELQTALDRFQRKWRWLNTLTVLGLLCLIPVFSFALLSLSDRLWETPAWARFVLSVPVPIGMVLSILPWVRRWVFERPGPERVAKFMGKLDSRVGDRLLGAVELAHGGNESWAGSPALRQAAILQVTRQLSEVRAEERLDRKKTRKIIAVAGGIFAGLLFYLVWVPDAALNSFQRWLKPSSAIERFTFVRLSGFPNDLVVPHGEDFEFSGEVNHVNNEVVTEVLSNVNGPEEVEVNLQDSQVKVRADGMTENREVTLRSGDAKARVSVTPMLRPELVSMSASVEWPEYLGAEVQDVVMRRRRLEVPIGSEVVMKGRVSRVLSSAHIGNVDALQIQGAGFEMPGILVDTNQNLALTWVDEVGLQPRQPASVELIAKADMPPRVSLSGIGATVAVLEDEFLELDVSARDDFGLEDVWAQFKQLKMDAQGPEVLNESMKMEGTSGAERLVFSPERLGYGPNSMIELIAMAVDAYPDREASQSSRYRILVLSKEDHAKMVLSQMDRVLAELDEAIRQEALSLETNQNTANRESADLESESTAEKLLDRALDELARAEQLKETNRSMESLIGEATKNEQIKDEQIADWAEISEKLKNQAVPAMTDAAEALKKASEAQKDAGEAGDVHEETGGDTVLQEQAPGEPESERKKQLGEAIKKQEEALEAMKQGEEDLNESIVNSLSESFINRFKVLADQQLKIRDALNAILPQTIGMSMEDIPEELRLQIQENAKAEAEIYRESRYVFDDLEGFYRRSQKPELLEVTEGMTAENFTERLPELEELILANSIGRTTVEATEWNRLFLSWADMLTKETEDSGAGQGGGACDEEGETLETMIALIRAREQQEKLRRHTRELNESYGENLNFDREALSLSDRQYELAQTLIPLENRVVKPETKTLVSLASGEMMNVGVLLRQSVTTQESITIQTAVIELLAEALDQSMSGGEPPPPGEGSGQNAQAMMQAILQMMQAGSTPGEGMPGSMGGEGSTGFGDPGRGDISGSSSRSTGRAGEEGRAGSSDPTHWPGRYRGLMDEYFKAMEGGN